MKLDSIRALRGPNLWSDETVLEASLLGDLSGFGGETLARLRAALPQVVADRLAETTALEARLEGDIAEQTSLHWARLVGALACSLQYATGADVGYHHAQEWGSPPCSSKQPGSSKQPRTEHRIVVEYAEEEIGRKALAMAVEIVLAARAGTSLDLEAQLTELRHAYENERLGPSTGSIVRAALDRGIPARRLTSGSLVMLGHGARQRRIWAAETDRTSAIAEAIAQDKELTKSLLRAAGVPVPEGRPVESPEQAWEAAQEVGLPVVVKPRNGNQGRGVSVRLSSEEAVKLGYELARKQSSEIIVEKHVEGADFRLLVIGGKLVAAARREPPKVIGDGRNDIAELVRVENLDPRRGDDHSTSLSKLRLDEIGLEMLAEQGLAPESVPAAGQVVVLRRNANLSTGGTAADVTDEVHPEVAKRVADAAAMIGLDIAGIDVMAPRLDIPLEKSGGAIVEVNAAPGLRMHLEPSSGKPRNVGSAIIESMFGRGDDARIPIVAITGTNGKTTTTRCVAHLLKQHGLRVGMTCTDGIYVEGRRIDTGDCSGPKSARVVLGHPRVDAAVLETARGGMLREGLGFDWCDVAIVTNVGEGDHLGLNGIYTVEDLARVKEIPVRRVSPRGAAVLNADDPLVVAMAGAC
ncbi:MAG TPA: cyanophycin synthetase, partial [Polyangiaceae bacterium]|nr:cyanophycin synthetase [Polyangiaceae bacterium]